MNGNGYGYPGDDFQTMGYDAEDIQTVGAGAPYYIQPQARPQMLPAPRPMASPAQMAQYARQAAPMVRQLMMPGNAAAAGMSDARVRQIVAEELGRTVPQWFQSQQAVPGSPSEGELMSPLGLGSEELTDAVPTINLTAEPQRPFRGERLILSIFKSAGAAQVPVNLSNFTIGENSQLVGRGLLPAESFGPDAFGVRLAMTPAQPGIIISLTLTATVPAGESIVVTGTIVGRAVWGPRG